MKKQLPIVLATIGLAAGLSIAHAQGNGSGPGDISSLVRDVDSNSPGPETTIPFMKRGADANNDGIPDLMAFRFSVYQGGTTTLIRQTTAKALYYPAIPCTSPSQNSLYVDQSMNNFVGLAPSRESLIINLSVSCFDQADQTQKQAYRTYVYSADLATGAAWIFGINQEGVSLFTANIGGNDRLVLVTSTPVVGGENAIVRVFDPSTGATVTANSYPVNR